MSLSIGMQTETQVSFHKVSFIKEETIKTLWSSEIKNAQFILHPNGLLTIAKGRSENREIKSEKSSYYGLYESKVNRKQADTLQILSILYNGIPCPRQHIT